MQERRRPLFSISVVARMLDVHPQTLRLYEREGLIVPSRTKGKTRQYSLEDIERLRNILHLTQEMGVNLAGVGLFLEFQDRVGGLDQVLRRALERRKEESAPRPPGDDGKKVIKVKIERG